MLSYHCLHITLVSDTSLHNITLVYSYLLHLVGAGRDEGPAGRGAVLFSARSLCNPPPDSHRGPGAGLSGGLNSQRLSVIRGANVFLGFKAMQLTARVNLIGAGYECGVHIAHLKDRVDVGRNCWCGARVDRISSGTAAADWLK